MKLIIAGGRDFTNYELLYNTVTNFINNDSNIEIISGGANGADKLGERYATENGYLIIKFLAKWDKYGKSAGYKRNLEMAEYADSCICFWDGKSKGTNHMITIAKNKGLLITIIKY